MVLLRLVHRLQVRVHRVVGVSRAWGLCPLGLGPGASADATLMGVQERMTFHYSLTPIADGSGNSGQCSCTIVRRK